MTPSQLAQTIKQRATVLPKKQQLILGAAILLLAALVFVFGVGSRQNDVVVMQPVDVTNPAHVAAKLDVSETKAKEVVKAIEKAVQKQPAASWSVEANDPKAAAETVSKQIEEKKTPPMPPADKTVVTPKETKVDVYRIDLDADWEVGIGYGNHDGKSYVPVEVQRNYAKHKAVAAEVHMDMGLKEAQGYEVKHVWRF